MTNLTMTAVVPHRRRVGPGGGCRLVIDVVNETEHKSGQLAHGMTRP